MPEMPSLVNDEIMLPLGGNMYEQIQVLGTMTEVLFNDKVPTRG